MARLHSARRGSSSRARSLSASCPLRLPPIACAADWRGLCRAPFAVSPVRNIVITGRPVPGHGCARVGGGTSHRQRASKYLRSMPRFAATAADAGSNCSASLSSSSAVSQCPSACSAMARLHRETVCAGCAFTARRRTAMAAAVSPKSQRSFPRQFIVSMLPGSTFSARL
jgi:hypothetical protein